MKVWIERNYRSFAGEVYIHFEEPQSCGKYAWEKDHVYTYLLPGEQQMWGFETPEGTDLYEYDLSGKKPELVDIWEPA